MVCFRREELTIYFIFLNVVVDFSEEHQFVRARVRSTEFCEISEQKRDLMFKVK